MPLEQLGLFGTGPLAPEGFRYEPNIISAEEERQLLEQIQTLQFKAFEFHGFVGNRRIVSFGYHYDFASETLRSASEIPAFLLPLRERAARLAGIDPALLQEALVTEYDEGAGIGWHRDKATFENIVGISLRAPCVFRLRRKVGSTWERFSVLAEPRSAYLLSGAARNEWEHSIPEVGARRYSITFRDLR